MLIISPSPRWVREITGRTGDSIKKGSIILRFDAYDLERQIAKLQSKLELNAVSAERLLEDYINKYVYRPLDELIEVRRKEYDFAEDFLRTQKDRQRVGAVKGAGVIGNEKDGTVALSDKDLQDAQYAYVEAKQEKQKKISEVNEERAKNSSERAETQDSINLLTELVARRTIKAPVDGFVTYKCVIGQFVAKGDIVAELREDAP